MMLIAPPPVNVGSASVTERPVAAEVCYVNQRLNDDAPILAELQQRHFAYGEHFLSLERNPQLRVNTRTRSIEIVGWNIQLSGTQMGEVSRAILRKFLFLYGKAELRELTEAESREWTEIVKQVDYRKFSIENAPPVYVEGKLVGVTSTGYEIEWHDGAKESVSFAIGNASLCLLNPGEWFKAFGKFGEQNRLEGLSQLRPMPALDSTKGDVLWQSWASNRS